MLLTTREIIDLTGRERRPAVQYEPTQRPSILPLKRGTVPESIRQANSPLFPQHLYKRSVLTR